MKDDLKGELDGLFAREEKEIAKRDARQKALIAQRNDPFKEFVRVRQEIIRPAIQEFADYITPKGWTVRITAAEYADGKLGMRDDRFVANESPSITARFVRGSAATESYPYFIFGFDPATKGFWTEANTGQSKTAPRKQDDLKLGELSTEIVQQRLLSFFKKLMSQSTPLTGM